MGEKIKDGGPAFGQEADLRWLDYEALRQRAEAMAEALEECHAMLLMYAGLGPNDATPAIQLSREVLSAYRAAGKEG